MYQAYAELLGRHATSVIRQMSGLKPTQVNMTGDSMLSGQVYALAVSVEFTGAMADHGPVRGYFIFSFKHKEDAYPMAAAIARQLGLPEDMVETPEGLANILSELLNVIIGLTGSGWFDLGLDIDFGPPTVIHGRRLSNPPMGASAYQITIDTDGAPMVTISIRFLADKK